EKPEVKPDPKPETKPEEKLPVEIDKKLVAENVEYNKVAMDNTPIAKNSISLEAQNVLHSVNNKYGTELKYSDLSGTISLVDKNMYLPAGSLKSQFYVDAIDENNFEIVFLYNNEATVELAKRWVALLNPALNLDKEIQETVDAQVINNYVKENHKVRVGHSTADKMMYVQVKKK
ncbi:cell surface protein, partial [Bacillus cereus]|nr:cell surface protein [Bacillus cereus]